VPAPKRRLEEIFSMRHERTVNKDNTVVLGHQVLQIDKSRWRATLAGCRVIIPEHLDGRVTISYGPHVVARFADGRVENRAPLKKRKGCGKDGTMERVENRNRTDHVLLKPDILTCYGQPESDADFPRTGRIRWYRRRHGGG